MLVTIIFSFSHSVFKKHVLQTCRNHGLFGKRLKKPTCRKYHGYIFQQTFTSAILSYMSHPLTKWDLTHYHTMPHFDALKIYSCGKTLWEKEKLLVRSNFSFSQNVFIPYMALIFHFKCTSKCRLQFASIRTSLKFCGLVMGFKVCSRYIIPGRSSHHYISINLFCLSEIEGSLDIKIKKQKIRRKVNLRGLQMYERLFFFCRKMTNIIISLNNSLTTKFKTIFEAFSHQ